MFLLDIFFPPRCVFCRSVSRNPICDTCQAALPWITQQKAGCVAAPLRYTGSVPQAFRRYKFYGQAYYHKTLAKLIAQAVKDADLPSIDICTYIPVSFRRLRQRGYNQAKRLCTAAANELGLPWKRCLRKTHHTRSQLKVSGADRRKNIKNAFASVGDVSGKVILLMDDVYTTGATMQEARSCLLSAGAEAVYCAAGALAGHKEGRYSSGEMKNPCKQY